MSRTSRRFINPHISHISVLKLALFFMCTLVPLSRTTLSGVERRSAKSGAIAWSAMKTSWTVRRQRGAKRRRVRRT